MTYRTLVILFCLVTILTTNQRKISRENFFVSNRKWGEVKTIIISSYNYLNCFVRSGDLPHTTQKKKMVNNLWARTNWCSLLIKYETKRKIIIIFSFSRLFWQIIRTMSDVKWMCAGVVACIYKTKTKTKKNEQKLCVLYYVGVPHI